MRSFPPFPVASRHTARPKGEQSPLRNRVNVRAKNDTSVEFLTRRRCRARCDRGEWFFHGFDCQTVPAVPSGLTAHCSPWRASPSQSLIQQADAIGHSTGMDGNLSTNRDSVVDTRGGQPIASHPRLVPRRSPRRPPCRRHPASAPPTRPRRLGQFRTWFPVQVRRFDNRCAVRNHPDEKSAPRWTGHRRQAVSIFANRFWASKIYFSRWPRCG